VATVYIIRSDPILNAKNVGGRKLQLSAKQLQISEEEIMGA